MRLFALVSLAALVALTGCRKKSAPEYYGWESNHSILVSRDGDEAYSSADMDAVVAGLQAIPADTVEGPKAAALLAKIAAERARIQAEAQEAAAPAAKEWVPPTIVASEVKPPTGEAPSVRDAGPPAAPWAGMSTAELIKYFGSCMKAGDKVTVPGLGEAETYVVQKTGDCEKKYGSNQPDTDTLFLFVKDRLTGQRTQTKTTTIIDAGAYPSIIDAGIVGGAPAPLLPGMPTPPGYTGVPGAPQGQ